ncbi:hypothetical protein LCGC14_0951770 [marine sediment metagenome]|uniref:Uncharacterized protein n=1 Tax=marine sediment metagenome TaxID=412755 RepID=A0A0F9R0I7_9ZZZZ
MPARYSVTGAQGTTTATPGDSTLGIGSGTDQRPSLYDWTSGFGGTPADNVIQVLLRKMTALGTATGVTPVDIDEGGVASLTTCAEDHTVEPTYTAASELFDQLINQRATYRWVAAPGGEIVLPATAASGVGWTAFHASYTGSHEVSAHFID